MQLAIDTSMCMAHGRCYTLAPDLVHADDEGYPVLTAAALDLAPDQETVADDIIGSCPEGAITLLRG